MAYEIRLSYETVRSCYHFAPVGDQQLVASITRRQGSSDLFLDLRWCSRTSSGLLYTRRGIRMPSAHIEQLEAAIAAVRRGLEEVHAEEAQR